MKRPVRILHFAEGSDTSGYFPQLARHHDRDRFEMIFATLKPTAPWLREYMGSVGVECHSCEAPRRATYPRAAAGLARFLRGRDVRIVHAHLFDPAVVGLAAAVMARTPVRVLTRHHSDYHTRIQKHAHVALDRLCTRMAHRVIAVSKHTARHLVEVEGAPPAKVVAIHNGIDFERVRPTPGRTAADVRREIGAGDAPMALVVARLHPEKGYEHLFRALALAHVDLEPAPRLYVAGTGPFLLDYQRMTGEMGLEGRVHFLGFRRDVADLMAAADVVVLPSVAEAFGLAAAEAVYLGTPVVASRVGGIPEIVADGVDGLLVEPGDAAGLARALVRVLGDGAFRERLRGAGRERIAARFQFADMMRRYEAVYGDLLART